MRANPIIMADAYKGVHPFMHPAGLTGEFAYLEARTHGKFDRTVFFGLQAFIKDYLFTPVTHADVDEAEALLAGTGNAFPREGWERIVNVHGGYLPIRIRAVPEGTVIPTGNVLVTVENTDPEIPWITGWVETALLRAVWYPTTVATNSWRLRRSLAALVGKSCDDADEVVGKVSDFGARGVSSSESAGLGGLAHLVSFSRSATMEAHLLARRFYNAAQGESGKAVPSAEHSTILSWGKDREAEAYSHILDTFAKPGAVISVVSDSYDYWNTVNAMWSDSLVKQVVASGGLVAIRPDSGDPETVTLGTLAALENAYGSTVNKKGYRVLNNVRVVWGDGLTPSTLVRLAEDVVRKGYSLTNVFFGMGGGLLQQVHRDEGRFAYKVSAVQVNGEWRNVRKAPSTDATKASKAGRLALVRDHGEWKTVAEGSWDYENRENLLRVVYEDGRLLVDDTLAEIRFRAAGEV